jgi:S-DNA-T family DNA segregation ATPase FtsK/SpoIIIE
MAQRNKKKPSNWKSSRSRKSQNKGKSSSRGNTTSSSLIQITRDRKVDIFGVLIALIGLATVFGFASKSNNAIVGWWIQSLTALFGWGGYIFPIGLLLIGLWLILRDIDSFPDISIERCIGLFLFFILILTCFHFVLLLGSNTAPSMLVRQGRGGGYIGAWIQSILDKGLGVVGTIVVLIAWFLISLAITLDRSVLSLFGWITPLILRIQDSWDDFQANRAGRNTMKQFFKRVERKNNITEYTITPEELHSVQQNQPTSDVWNIGKRQEWILPNYEEILDQRSVIPVEDGYDEHRGQIIEETLASFGAPGHVVEINRGPTITQFGVEPAFIETRGKRTRVRVSKINSLADDLALALAATRVRIQAPVPGKGFVGIEVPNDQISLVALRDGIENDSFKRLKGKPLRFALGQDVAGNAIAADLAAMPHLLIAGTTGSGKSVCVNSIISCLLINNTPEDLRFLMVDPKRVELTGYDGIPHLLVPVVTEMDRVVGALQWATREMNERYHKFAEIGARNIIEYNQGMEVSDQKKLPYLVVIIDELADLMMLAPDETERTITRMAQLARATGIHMVISTQRPSVDVVTGLIKANFPARIAFATASGVDSRVILDQPGAERLLGRGDMLFQAPDASEPIRLQGVWVSDQELLRLVQHWRGIAGYTAPVSAATAAGGIPDMIPRGVPLKQMPMFEEMEAEEDSDPLYEEALDLIRRQGRASISMLQRRLRIGYTRAARLIETMEIKGIVSAPQPGSQIREVLDYGPASPPVDEE